ncbi:MAG: oligosaccharide flippase family protein [Clostridium sp.]
MNSLVKNSFYKLILNVCNLVIPLLIGPYALRVIGDTNMGSVYFSETVYGYFFIFSSFGLYQYGLREISKLRDDKTKLKQLFSSLFCISILASGISFVAYLIFIKFKYGGDPEYILMAIYSINIIFNMFYVEYVVEALEEYKFITIKTLVVKVTYFILLVTMVKSENDTNLYLILLVLSMVANNLISYLYIVKKIGYDFSNIRIKPHIKFLVITVLMANVNTLFTTLDRFVLGEFLDKAVVTYYVIPQSISGTVNALMLSFIAVAVPRLSNTLATGGKEKYEDLLNRVSNQFFYILIPAAVGLIVIGKEIMILYGGSDLEPATTTMKIFSIYFITLSLEYIFTNHILYVNGKENRIIWFLFASGGLNLVLKLLLINFGLLSDKTAIITTLIANSCLLAIEYVYIKRYLNIRYNIFNRRNLETVIVCLSFFVIKFMLDKVIGSMFILTAATVTLCGIVYSVYAVNRCELIGNIVKGSINKIIKK